MIVEQKGRRHRIQKFPMNRRIQLKAAKLKKEIEFDKSSSTITMGQEKWDKKVSTTLYGKKFFLSKN
jgi:hypothetical protein